VSVKVAVKGIIDFMNPKAITYVTEFIIDINNHIPHVAGFGVELPLHICLIYNKEADITANIDNIENVSDMIHLPYPRQY
jgi:hypothetical protein